MPQITIDCVVGGLVVLACIFLSGQIKRAKRETDKEIAGLRALFISDVAALSKIAETLDMYVRMVQELRRETEATIQARAEYSEGLLQKACFANQSSTIERLETLQDTMAFLRGKRR